MKTKATRNLAGILFVVGMLSVFSVIILAEEYKFAGTWRGEYNPTAGVTPPAGGATPAPRGGFGGQTGPQKVTLRVKVNKNNKATGNFTVGSGATDDIHEGKVEGNKLTFKTGLSGQTIYDNDAVMIGEELTVTRTASGGRGGRPQVITLKRDK